LRISSLAANFKLNKWSAKFGNNSIKPQSKYLATYYPYLMSNVSKCSIVMKLLGNGMCVSNVACVLTSVSHVRNKVTSLGVEWNWRRTGTCSSVATVMVPQSHSDFDGIIS
jgi:hypothetical protein